MFAKTVAQAMHCRKAWRPLRGQVRSYAGRTCSRRRSLRRCIVGKLGGPFADKSAPTPVGQNQKRPPARGIGANLFAKTVAQAMHVRKAWRPLRGQVRSYAPRAESKTASCPRDRGELVREDGRSGDACSKAWRPLRGQVRSYARWAESKTAFCPRGRGELVREDGRSGDALSESLAAPSRTSPLLRPLGIIKNGLLPEG